jgi:hypothetical protein
VTLLALIHPDTGEGMSLEDRDVAVRRLVQRDNPQVDAPIDVREHPAVERGQIVVVNPTLFAEMTREYVREAASVGARLGEVARQVAIEMERNDALWRMDAIVNGELIAESRRRRPSVGVNLLTAYEGFDGMQLPERTECWRIIGGSMCGNAVPEDDEVGLCSSCKAALRDA